MDFRTEQRKARLKELCKKRIYPWLVSLAERNKESGYFPLFLGDFYPSPKDKEVAEAASLLFPLEEQRLNYLMRMRNVLGNEPREMVETRSFVYSSDRLRVSTLYSESVVFNVLDWIWETCCQDRIPLEYVVLGELGIIKRHHRTPLCEIFPEKDIKVKLELLLNKMTQTDGMGSGLWHFMSPQELPCPMTKEALRVMRAYYPIEKGMTTDTPSEIIKFFGFKTQSDFMYAVWEYEQLRKQHKKEIAAQEKKIHKWYKSARIANLSLVLE